MNNTSNIVCCNKVERLKSHLKNYIEQKIHWAQRAKQSWLQFVNRNKNFFQTMATIRKGRNFIWKIKDKQGDLFEDQDGISRVITRAFQKRFKADKIVNPLQAIPLSRDISVADN